MGRAPVAVDSEMQGLGAAFLCRAGIDRARPPRCLGRRRENSRIRLAPFPPAQVAVAPWPPLRYATAVPILKSGTNPGRPTPHPDILEVLRRRPSRVALRSSVYV